MRSFNGQRQSITMTHKPIYTANCFGYEFLFIVIDKNTHQIGMFDCSPQFYEKGEDKVRKASEAYDLFYKTKDFDPKQYFISKTL